MTYAQALSERITLLKYSSLDDGAGGQIESFTAIDNIPAHVKTLRSNPETIRSGQIHNVFKIEVTLREEHDVDFKDHLIFNDREYEIVTISHQNRRSPFVRLQCQFYLR